MTLKLLAFLPFFSICVFAQSAMRVKAIQVSKTQKSLSLNIGDADDLKTGTSAVLIDVNFQEVQKRKVYLPVAKIRSVKILGNQSLWIVTQKYTDKAIDGNKNYIYLDQELVLRGRTDMKASESMIISNKDELTEKTLKKLQSNDSSQISQENKSREVVAQTNQKLEVFDEDIELVSVMQWQKYFNEKQAKSIYKSQHLDTFREQKSLATFEKVLFSQLAKWNSADYQTHTLFDEQKRSPFQDQLQQKGIKDSYFTGSMQARKEKYDKLERFKDRMESKKGWSSDYSDEELSFLVQEYGIQKERTNLDKIINYQYDSQLITSFGVNLLDNENLNDPDDTVALKYDLQVGFEHYAFKKFKNLSAFTVEFSLRKAQDSFTTGKFNATSQELSLATAVNWYPFRSANLVDANIFYFSTYIRYGLTQVDSTGLNSSGQYQIYSFPGISAGLKYNFNNLWGMRFVSSFENIILDRLETTDPDGLPDRLSYFDGKISFGITRFI